jgi:hypothetical protein
MFFLNLRFRFINDYSYDNVFFLLNMAIINSIWIENRKKNNSLRWISLKWFNFHSSKIIIKHLGQGFFRRSLTLKQFTRITISLNNEILLCLLILDETYSWDIKRIWNNDELVIVRRYSEKKLGKINSNHMRLVY